MRIPISLTIALSCPIAFGGEAGQPTTTLRCEVVDADNQLATRLSKYKVGDTVEITYVRDGKEQTTKVTLEASPSN